MIRPLTEQDRSVKSHARTWAADATRGAREASGLSAEDYGDKCGVSESRQLAFERQDEPGTKTENPRAQLDKIARWPFVSRLMLCRGLLGTRAVIVETNVAKVVLDAAAGALTKENADAVCASLPKAHTPESLRNLAREARELAEVAIGVELAAIEEAERLEAMAKPLRAVKS